MTAARNRAAGDGVTQALRHAAEHHPPEGGVSWSQLRRLAAIEAEHPEAAIRRAPGGEWVADVPLGESEPYDGGGGVVHDPDLGGLLGKLDDHLGPPG